MRAKNWTRFALAVLAGCVISSGYLDSPLDATYWSDGYPVAADPVPPETPQGWVDVTSFGIVEKPDGDAPIAVRDHRRQP